MASNIIKNMIRWARVTLAGTEEGEYPVQQTAYLGKVADSVMWFPYGFHANIPPDQGDGLGSLALQFSIAGNGEARVSIPGSPTTRPRDLVAGEVVVFHPPSGSKIHFKSNGDIEVTSDTEVTVTAPLTTVDGDLTVTGDLTMEGALAHEGSTVGFHGNTPVAQQTITGNKSGGSAQVDLYTDLDTLGLYDDQST